MAESIIDATEVGGYADVLRRASEEALSEGERIISKGALNVKNDARRLAPSGGHAVHYPASISYDVKHGADWVEAEVGPVEGRRQRGLGNLLEYGGPFNPPHPHHEPAADAEDPRLFSQAEKLAERLMERHG